MIKRIDVFAHKIKVGTLALTNDNRVAFQYDDEWLNKGFSINPFKLPLSKQLFFSTSPYFNGLFGVFADSLPDS
ncbi:MAG: HipA N-terminal domain-containing protein, partial [Bacilli bacterium]|nr:HipA N-terminal domain-containing protein [Bacilli bacterium]